MSYCKSPAELKRQIDAACTAAKDLVVFRMEEERKQNPNYLAQSARADTVLDELPEKIRETARQVHPAGGPKTVMTVLVYMLEDADYTGMRDQPLITELIDGVAKLVFERLLEMGRHPRLAVARIDRSQRLPKYELCLYIDVPLV